MVQPTHNSITFSYFGRDPRRRQLRADNTITSPLETQPGNDSANEDFRCRGAAGGGATATHALRPGDLLVQCAPCAAGGARLERARGSNTWLGALGPSGASDTESLCLSIMTICMVGAAAPPIAAARGRAPARNAHIGRGQNFLCVLMLAPT